MTPDTWAKIREMHRLGWDVNLTSTAAGCWECSSFRGDVQGSHSKEADHDGHGFSHVKSEDRFQADDHPVHRRTLDVDAAVAMVHDAAMAVVPGKPYAD